MKKAHWHAIWVTVASGALVVLANALSNMSDALTAHPVAFKAVLVGVLTGAASRGIGAYLGSQTVQQPPTPPQP